jgi:GDPmannose 4,6-dehydratase
MAGFELTRNYRESYNLFAISGILFNHESPRRGSEFVTRKITSAAAKIKLGLEKEIRLGNLKAKRDWGHAREYVQAMWLMLQQDKPEDYVIATGKTHSVEDFLRTACVYLNMDYRDYIVIDENLFRPAEVHLLQGNYTKAHHNLNWSPNVSFEELVHEMVEFDIARYKKTSAK